MHRIDGAADNPEAKKPEIEYKVIDTSGATLLLDSYLSV